MLFQVCLLAAAQIAGDSAHAPAHAPGAPNGKAPANEQRPASLPQAEARMVDSFNRLVAAMQDFSAGYNGNRSVNARKAQAVRRAWKEFEAAESECQKLKPGR
jgi:hypothetical protein